MKKNILNYIRVVATVFIIMFIFAYGYVSASAYIDMHLDPEQANGSLIIENRTVVGSYLLAEAFAEPWLFHPRPSFSNYTVPSSGGVPYSLNNTTQFNQTKNYIKNFEKQNPEINASDIPFSAVSYSGSGLDPDISLSNVYLQFPRVLNALQSFISSQGVHASKGNISSFLNKTIHNLMEQSFPLFGTYYVNVVKLNFSILLYLKGYGINLF